MTKKIVALIIAFILTTLFSSVYAVEEKRLQVSGTTYSVVLSDTAELTGGSTDSGLLVLNGGTAKYEFTLPIYSDYVIIKSDSKGQQISLKINDVSETITLSSPETEYKFATPIRIGEKNMQITAAGNVAISSIVFNEITEERSYTPIKLDTSDYEEATSTAFIIKEGSPIIKIHSALRYLDYNDISVCPVYVNGSLYIPAAILTDALDCYFEEDKSRDFMIIRKQNKELLYLNGKFTFAVDGNFKDIDLEKTEINGKTFLPVRYIGELFDNYIYYKNGFVIGDYRSRARAVAEGFYNEIEKEFADYVPLQTSAKTYYVSKAANASDENDGSYERPFSTIAKASEMAVAGDTVILREGEYKEVLIPKHDGTAASPITYKAADGEEVILSALEEITGFAEYKDDILLASVPWDLGLGRNQVFYKNKNLVEARYPNTPVEEDGLFTFSNGLRLDPLWITQGDIRVSAENTDVALSDTLLTEPDGYWNGAVFISAHGEGWTLCSAIVKNSTRGKLELRGLSTKWWFKAEGNYPNYGYLTCHENCIDLPGEWTMKNNLIYIKAPEGETPDTLKISVKKRQLICDLNDRKYIHIEGLKGIGGGLRMNNSKMCVINGCDFEYISHYSYSVDNRSLYIEDGNDFNTNGAPQRGEVGIFIGGSDNAVVNSTVKFSAGTGIFLVGSYALIDNNVFNDIGYGGTSCGGIHMDTEAFKSQTTKKGGHAIYRNTVYNVGRNAISVNHSAVTGWERQSYLPCTIAYNDVYDAAICSLDTGVIYMWGSYLGNGPLSTTKIHNNYVYSTATKGGSIVGAIYNDNWISGVDNFDNIIFANMYGKFGSTIYEQRKRQFPETYATVDSWNNIDLEIKSNAEADFKITDFPTAKPFKAGADSIKKDYSLTYDYYAKSNPDIYYAKDAVVSEGVEIKDSRARFTGENQWIKFENVHFDSSEGSVVNLNLVYSADYYKENDVYEIIVGDDIETGDKFEVVLYPESKDLKDFNTISAKISEIEIKGTKSVWIKPKKFGGASIYQLHLNKIIGMEPYDYKMIYGGMFSEYHASPIQAPTYTLRYFGIEAYPVLIRTWGQGWVKYGKVNVSEKVNNLKMQLACGEPNVGGVISLRIGSPDGEVLAQVIGKDTEWKFKEVKLPLSRALEPGIYDLYLTFDGDQQKADILSFGLY